MNIRDSAMNCEGMRRPLTDRFWEKVQKGEGCWRWIGALDGPGYGIIGSGGRSGKLKKAHRVSWEIHFGEIPAGAVIMHKCDNPACVNPSHLRVGSVAENNADRQQKGRSARTDGVNSPRTRLTEEMVRHIRLRTRAGERLQTVADEFGISKSAAFAIKSGRNWANLHD